MEDFFTLDLGDLSLPFFFSFLVRLSTFTFSLKGSTLWVVFGISEWLASPLLPFGII